ncbi:MAG TPA: DUF3500 domain-containing protein [Pirellulales bacterium]|jgi:hypothetical protein|nr:DUF3500 domain-containing protein [Pirellulales bacterium]
MSKAQTNRPCPDCDAETEWFNRREFMRSAGVAVAAGAVGAAIGSLPVHVLAGETAGSVPSISQKPESIVKQLYDSLSESQKGKICFDWDYMDKLPGAKNRGLLRTRVSNNWNITPTMINSEFYTKDQKQMIREVYEGILNPDWIKRVDKQIEDDAHGYGEQQSIAIFGHPGVDKFEFVMTGRHMTIRCDGHSADHVAFGGPIFYGHAAQGFNEKADHPGNVYWYQALAANKVYGMLDERHRKLALVEKLPKEEAAGFRGPDGQYPGVPVTELSSDQKEELQKVLGKLVEHYRQSDQDDALRCLKVQGGLDKCSLAFYREGDIGDDQVWDCWRLEGPAFVWYFRGAPHVHVWVNVADDPTIKLNA